MFKGITKAFSKWLKNKHELKMIGSLYAIHYRNGKVFEDHGKIAENVVTDTGVAFLVDAWQNTVELETMKYHGVGVGVGAEAAGDTDLGTPCTTQTNPDNTRATGSLAEGAANIFRTVGTVTFDASAAITEHGIFSDPTEGSGVMWDRSVFSAINVVDTDSIQFTYDLTVTSGG